MLYKISNHFSKNFIQHPSRYRPDLDLLRGVAIFMVVLFHIFPSSYHGGFIGVDIFFVISGFIITKVIFERKYSSNLQFLLDFYSRRIKRILPALLTYVLVVSLVLSLYVYEPFVYLKTGFFAIFGFSNIFLASRTTQYFSETTDLNPFAQTWSLGVEEQFYILFPLLCILCAFALRKQKKFFSFLIAVFSFSSFLLFFSSSDIQSIYFLPQFRFWEIGFGSILFLYLHLFPTAYWSPSNLLKAKSAVLIFLVLSSFLLQNNKLLIILSVLLTTIFIAINPQPSRTSNPSTLYPFPLKLFLILPIFFRHLGLLSYSLYLWHWGFKIFYDWTFASSPFRGLFIFIGSYLISLFSYNIIEKPFRSINTTSMKSILFGILSLLFSSGLVLSLRRNTYNFFLPSQFRIWGSTQQINPSNCNVRDISIAGISNAFKRCSQIHPSPSLTDIFILGDSHSRHHLPLASYLSYKFGNDAQYHHVRCGNAPFPGLLEGNEASAYRDQTCSNNLISYLRQNIDSSDYIILSSRWLSNLYPGIYDYHTGKSGGVSIDKYPNEFDSTDVYNHLATQIKTLLSGFTSSPSTPNPTIVFLGSLPDFPNYLTKPPSELLGYCESDRFFGDQIFHSDLCIRNASSVPREEAYDRELFLKNSLLKNLPTNSKLIYFDQFSVVCPPSNSFCSTHLPDGTILFSDDDHLSRKASIMIADSLYTKLLSIKTP